MKISNILEKIEDKQLFVPAFQREFVWRREDAKQLVDSLIKEYPTGTMLTWETANPPEFKGPHKYNDSQGAVRVLLDGQQRVTTLYMLIRGAIPPYYTIEEIMHDPRGLYVNLDTLELSYYVKTRMEGNPLWQNITDVLQGKVSAFDLHDQFRQLDAELNNEQLKRLNDHINRITLIKDRDFPEQSVPPHATVREAIDIFYKVNASGVSLTDAELALAQISGYWPEARQRFKRKLAALEREGFLLRLDFLVYVLLGCLHHMGSDMRRLHGEENRERLQDAWGRLEGPVLDYAVNLLRSRACVDHSDEINSIYALVPIIVYCFDKPGTHLTDTEIRKLVKWFYYSQIRARYVSQMPQKLDHDLRIVKESRQPFDDLLQIIAEESRLEIMPYEFVGRGVRHPLFSMVRWYLKSRGAVCMTTGMPIRKNMGSKYELEWDHIFPYSRLKKRGYGKGNRVKYALAQELTNRAILTQVANRAKAGRTAAKYLAWARERFPKALELQCIPEDENLWELDNYERFLEARRKLLADHLNGFLEGITKTEEAATGVTLEDMIAEGESDELEFKASLRWDVRERMINKKLEEGVIKTVAAFANSQGGTLLIGIDDDGQIEGLDHDYLSLGGADQDKFELHLRNLLNQHLGKAFVASKVEVNFLEVAGEEICQVDVQPATAPVVMKAKGKDGQSTEKLYVRSGNSSQEIPLSEMHEYIKERF